MTTNRQSLYQRKQKKGQILAWTNLGLKQRLQFAVTFEYDDVKMMWVDTL